jgi:hypothetical protein
MATHAAGDLCARVHDIRNDIEDLSDDTKLQVLAELIDFAQELATALSIDLYKKMDEIVAARDMHATVNPEAHGHDLVLEDGTRVDLKTSKVVRGRSNFMIKFPARKNGEVLVKYAERTRVIVRNRGDLLMRVGKKNVAQIHADFVAEFLAQRILANTREERLDVVNWGSRQCTRCRGFHRLDSFVTAAREDYTQKDATWWRELFYRKVPSQCKD